MEHLGSIYVTYTSFNKVLSIKNMDTTYEKSILNKAFPRCVQGTRIQNYYKFAINKGAIRVNTNNLSLNILSSNKMCLIKNNETAFYT